MDAILRSMPGVHWNPMGKRALSRSAPRNSRVGQREYDPACMGYAGSDPASKVCQDYKVQPASPVFVYDISLPGNSNKDTRARTKAPNFRKRSGSICLNSLKVCEETLVSLLRLHDSLLLQFSTAGTSLRFVLRETVPWCVYSRKSLS